MNESNESKVELCHWCQEDPVLQGKDLCYMCYSLATVQWDDDGRMYYPKEDDDA